MDCSFPVPGFPVLHYLPEFAQTHVHWVNDPVQPPHPLSSPSLTLHLSSIRIFSNESALHIRRPKYWSLSFDISPSNEYSRLISFRIDWFDHLAVKGTCKSLLQHHNSEASILWCSTFFMVQLSHPYMTTGKTDVEAETPILWPPDLKNWPIWKDPDAGKDWRQEEKGSPEDEMVGRHCQLNGHEFE